MSDLFHFDWQDRALCRHPYYDDLDWFCEPMDWPMRSRLNECCSLCQVSLECLDLAVKLGPSNDVGVWAGLDGDQRAALRKRLRRQRLVAV